MAAEVPLLTILYCARPVLFYNDDRDYPYSTSGTAFVVEFGARLFVVTAKHVLRLREFSADQFRVQYRPDASELMPTRRLYSFTPTDANDTDQEDLVAWEVDSELVDAELFGRYPPYRIRQEEAAQPFRAEADYLYRGYPTEHRRIDFEARRYAQDSVSGAADYLGGDNAANSLHRLRFRYFDERVTDLNGLSGAPVFQTRPTEGNYAEAAFAGMLLRGARGPMLGFFLEHRRIIELLVEIVAGRVRTVGHPPRQ